MNKKKVGELEGTPIVIGKKNYAKEHEYYLTMNEDNTYLKLELRVSGDKFRLVLGGGSNNNYPTVTAGDVNKVWQVTPVQKGTKIEESVIVPEQTILYTGNSTFPYDDRFVPGAQCVATIDGVKYSGEVVYDDGFYIFHCTDNFGFEADINSNLFQFYANDSGEYSIELSIVEEVPDYDYNWAPGVKIPIPTAEDEGKILVVTKVTDESSVSTIVPEQEVPADDQTPLTDVDLKYFVPGNIVTVTVTVTEPDEPDEEEKGGDVALKGPKSANSNTIVASGTIGQGKAGIGVIFNEGQESEFYIAKIPYGEPETPLMPDGPKSINTKSSTDTEYILITNLYGIIDSGEGSNNARSNTIPYATIKLEYSEPNYEYLLQENSGSGGEERGNDIYKNIAPFAVLSRTPTEEEYNAYGSEYSWEDDDIRIIELPANLKIPPVNIIVSRIGRFDTFIVDDWHFDTTYNIYGLGRYYTRYDNDNNIISFSASSEGNQGGNVMYFNKINEETNILKFYFRYTPTSGQ